MGSDPPCARRSLHLDESDLTENTRLPVGCTNTISLQIMRSGDVTEFVHPTGRDGYHWNGRGGS